MLFDAVVVIVVVDIVFAIVVFEGNVWLAAAELRWLVHVSISSLRQDQHDASCTRIFLPLPLMITGIYLFIISGLIIHRVPGWAWSYLAMPGYTWLHNAHCTCPEHYAHPPLGTLQLSHFLQQIFARIYKQFQDVFTTEVFTTTNWIFTAANQILTGSNFYNWLPNPLLWWPSVVSLFPSSPQIPIRFVFFAAFLGHRLLAVFWCFCEALAVGWEGRSVENTRGFSQQTPTGHWGAFYEPGRPDLARLADKNLGKHKTWMIINHNFKQEFARTELSWVIPKDLV